MAKKESTMTQFIAKIKDSNNVPYDLAAKYFKYEDDNLLLEDASDWKEYIDQIAELGFEVIKLNSLPAATEANWNIYHNNIVLIEDQTSETGSCVEYVILRSGTVGSYTYAWEKIGTTSSDLSEYLLKDTYNGHTHSVTVPTISQAAKKLSITKATPESVSVVPSYSPSMGKLGTTSVVPAVANGTASKATAGTAKDVAKAGTAVSFDSVGEVSSEDDMVQITNYGTAGDDFNLVTGISAEANDTSSGGIAVVTAAKGAASLTGTKTFVTGVKSTNNGSAVVTNVTGNTAVAVLNSASLGSAAAGAGDMDVVTNVTGAISGASLSESTTSTDGPQYVKEVAISTTQFNTDAIKSVILSNDGVSGTNPAYVESISVANTYFAEDGISAVTLSNDGVSGTDPKYIEDVTISDTQFNTDAIKSASLSENDATATGRLQYLKDVAISTTKFNTDAIKDVTLSASATSTDGPGYVESITYEAATTDAIKNVNLTANTQTATGRIQYLQDASLTGGSAGTAAATAAALNAATVDINGVLSFGTGNFNTDAIKGVSLPTISKTTRYLSASGDAASVTGSKITAVSNKYMKRTLIDASKSAPTLTKTTKYMGISTSAASKSAPTLTKTTKYMKVNTTQADRTPLQSAVSPTTKYMKATGTAAGKSAPTLTTNTTKYMKITPVSSGVTVSKAGAKLTTGTTNVLPGITVTKNDFNTGTVGISNADATTKYLHISDTHVAATTRGVVTSVGKTAQSIAPAVSNGTITPYTFTDVTVAKVGTAVSVVNGISADSTGNIVMGITGATAVDVAKPMEAVTDIGAGATGTINFVESLTIGSASATSSVPSPQAN